MNGRLISNTGPIIALGVVDKIELLQKIFDEVVVPEPVHQEIIQGDKHVSGLASYEKATWILVEALKTPMDPLLETLLDRGEASVIHLAREKGADFVLIDERKARKIARRVYGMRVVGWRGILVEAKHRGIISHVRDALEGMRQAGYWIHDDIIRAALEETGEE